MIDSITRITLNLQETNTMVSIRAKRGDTGRKLLIHLSDGSIPYHISDDCYATFTAKKPDGTKINNACTIENNVIEYEFTEQTCTAVGTMKAEIRLYGADDKMITSACFLVNVYDTVFRDGDEVDSEGEMNTLDDLILRANAFLNETGKLLRWQGNWDSETEYEANDLVLHEQVLYVAEEAIPAGTEPGSEAVTAWVPIAGMGTGNGSSGDINLTGYATEQFVRDGYQPKGNYLTKVPDGYAKTSDIPTKVSAFTNDVGYLTKHQDISGKLDADKLPEAINDALAQAKESGEFDGEDGQTPMVTITEIIEAESDNSGIKVRSGVQIDIADEKGTKTAKIMDGLDGEDGVSPTVEVKKTGKVTTITITDVNGTKTATIHDGEDGAGSGGSGNNDHVFYTNNEPQNNMTDFLFDVSEIETDGRTIAVGDWIVTPSGRVYVVFAAEDYGIDATYDASLSVDSSDPDNVDLGITGATVGQIAKIIAVDEEGRPTAWESVDLPDSGGNADYGAENAGKLLYVGADGKATVLALGAGLAIVDGVLTITSQVVTSAICGQAVCGNAICGGA